jgi:hypothetical protein
MKKIGNRLVFPEEVTDLYIRHVQQIRENEAKVIHFCVSRGADLVTHHPPSITTHQKTKLFPADAQIDVFILIDYSAWSLNKGSNANLTNVPSHTTRNVGLTLILNMGHTFGGKC